MRVIVIYGRALTNATDYPIGSRCWNIHSPQFNGAVNLNLNACDDEEEYNCADGTCVVIEDRCNGKNDCPDGSDEQAKISKISPSCKALL